MTTLISRRCLGIVGIYQAPGFALAGPSRLVRGYAATAVKQKPKAAKTVSPKKAENANSQKSPPTIHRTRSGVAYKVPEKTDAPLTEEEQIAQLDQVMQMSRLYPTADPWGMKVDTLDVMLPYSTSLSTRSSYSSWGDMYNQFKENWLNRGKNYTSMVMLATENAIPGVDLSSARWWQKYFTQWPWRLGSTTSIKEDSWLTGLRKGALSSYCQLNTALANGDDQAIKRLTTHTYQDHMLKLRKKQQQRSKYIWHFHKEVSPARVLSIRANQGYLATDEPKFGNRMMVHALVRIDTEQSLEIYNAQGLPLHTRATNPIKGGSTAEPTRVTEYLVFEKRMWYDGPWIIREQLWETPGRKVIV